MTRPKTVADAREIYAALLKEQKELPGKLDWIDQKIQAKLAGDHLSEGLGELREAAEALRERGRALPTLIFDARDELIMAMRAEKQSLETLMNGAKLAAIDDLESALEDFSKAKDALEKKIMSNKNVQIFLDPLPNKDDQLVFDTILHRSFQNWGEPAGTPISAKVKRQLAERMGEISGLFIMRKENEIENLCNQR